METAFKVVLDIYEVQNQATISIKQGDTSGKLYITLCAYREKYIIPEGATAVLRMLKNGSPVFKACDIQENVITCDIGFATEFVGAHDLELAIYKDGKVLLTQTLIVKVYSNVYGNTGEGEIVDSEPFSALTELVSEATDLIHEVETKLENGDFVGEKGEKGDQGIQGEKGDKGDKGDQGEKGEDGKDGTIITVNGEEQTTWNADTKADVEEVFIIYDNLNHASTRIDKVEQDTKLVKEALFQKGIIARAEVEQAYTSRVTANGENIVDGQKTPVTLIKGSTVRCENLLDISKFVGGALTDNGDGTYTITKNGRYRFSKVWTFDTPIKLGMVKPSFTVVSTNGLEGETTDIACRFFRADGSARAFTLKLNGEGNAVDFLGDEYISAEMYMFVEATDGTYITFKNLMLNEGETAKPYQPYFTGLKHAYINSIKSTGRNLIPYPYKETTKTMNGITFTDNGDGSITVNGTATGSAYLFLAASSKIKLSAGKYTISGYKTGVIINANKNGVWWGQNGTLTAEEGDVFGNLSVYIENGRTINNVTVYPMFNRGETALPYEPYTEDTYQLPQTLELPKWDRFNPQTGEITRQTHRYVFDGSYALFNLNGSYTEGYRFDAGIGNAPPAFGDGSTATLDVVCSHFPTAKGTNRNGVWVVGAVSLQIRIITTEFSTAEELNAYLKAQYEAGTPVIVEYKLATPTVEKLENAPKSYTAYNQGDETAVLKNEEFGAIPTITNEYIVVL